MLRPTDTATRERKSLTGIWRFRLDAAGEGPSAEWFKRPLPDSARDGRAGQLQRHPRRRDGA